LKTFIHILKIVSITLLMVALGGYAIYAAIMAKKWHKDAICNELSINILDYNKYQFICEDDVAEIINKNKINPIGRKIDSRITDEIEKKVERINVVRSAECYLSNQNCVVIEITQKVPMFRVISNNRSYYVDSDRHTLKTGKRFATLLPLVTGNITESQACGDVYDFVIYLHNDSFWGNHIGQIHFTEDGDIELITKIGARKIILADLTSYKDKLKVAELWYKQYPKLAWSNLYTQVDLRYNNIIYCKKGGINE